MVEAATRILVVDDERNIAELVSIALKVSGFEVQTAGTARDARAAVREFRPALIVLDVGLPDMDGFELVQRLQADGIKAPVIFLTARDATEEKIHGLTVGGDDYVTKPFSLEELVARIRVVLRRQEPAGSRGSSTMVLADLELDDESYHGNGWHTSYYHLRNVRVVVGQQVQRGQWVGDTGTALPCGGKAVGNHTHFGVEYYTSGGFSFQRNMVDIRGMDIGGWTVWGATTRGCLINDRTFVRVCAGQAGLTNTGAVG